MNVNDVVLLASSAVSSMVMVLGGLLGRRRRRGRVVGGIPLGVRVSALVEYYRGVSQKTFKVEIPFAPEGFEGIWSCVKLGCGGWGCAYKCEQDDRVVVFKVPRGFEGIVEEGMAPTVSEKLLKRVIEEAVVLSRLNHPHILRLLSYSRHIPLLIYEYADYGSLQWQLDNGWRPNFKVVVLVGMQVGDALRYIHSRGLVHGDVKPGNIFFVDGIVKLGDFSSLVRLLAQTSTHSRFAYTPGWRAPEQVYSDLRSKIIERGLENRIDVYQLGNVILYLLTGESIDGEDTFKKDYVQQVLRKVSNAKLKDLSSEMLRSNPEERPSMDEVLKKLIEIYHELE